MNPNTHAPLENKLPEDDLNLLGSNVNFQGLAGQYNLEDTPLSFIHHTVINEAHHFHPQVPTEGGEKYPNAHFKLNAHGKRIPYVNLVGHAVPPSGKAARNIYLVGPAAKTPKEKPTEEDTDFWGVPIPNTITTLPGLHSSSALDDKWLDKFYDDVAPDAAADPGEASVTTQVETEAAQEKYARTRKLGKLVAKTTVQVGKVLSRVITKMGPVSVLYPGSALLQDERFTFREAALLFESQGYVKAAPTFREQVDDTNRTNTFRYARTPNEVKVEEAPADATVELTEHEGLVGLERFLNDFIRQSEGEPSEAKRRQIAQAMLENLTFIGAKEFAEAANGIGDYWKAYLDADPERQICLVTKVSEMFGGVRKSDKFLAETIIDGFSDKELQRFSGRIVTDLEDVTAEPADLKVVLLDDWTISGSQLQAAYGAITNSPNSRKYADRIEINLLAASLNRITNGLPERLWGENLATIPVRAYYLTHEAPYTAMYGEAHVSGTHSSVDFAFEEEIRRMVKYMKKNSKTNEKELSEDEAAVPSGSRTKEVAENVFMPPLTNIVRSYYTSAPAVEVKRDRIVRTQPRK